jgi:transcriptional regulator with XRE-family HTH domain
VPSLEPEVRYVAANIRQERRKLGMTQAEVAEAAEMSVRALSEVENGVVDLSVSTLCRIARALEVKPALLLRKAELVKPPAGRPRKRKI